MRKIVLILLMALVGFTAAFADRYRWEWVDDVVRIENIDSDPVEMWVGLYADFHDTPFSYKDNIKYVREVNAKEDALARFFYSIIISNEEHEINTFVMILTDKNVCYRFVDENGYYRIFKYVH